MNRKLTRILISLILIISLFVCEASVGFAAVRTVTANSTVATSNAGTLMEDGTQGSNSGGVGESTAETTMKITSVEYVSHTLKITSYPYTGKAIAPQLASLTLKVTTETTTTVIPEDTTTPEGDNGQTTPESGSGGDDSSAAINPDNTGMDPEGDTPDDDTTTTPTTTTTTKTETVTITNFSDKSLITLSYRNNVNIGTGYIVIKDANGALVKEIPFSIVFGSITSLKATPTSHTKIKINWNKVPGANGYVIYRSTKSNKGFKAVKTISNGNTVSYTNSKLKIGKTFYYKVRPYRVVNGKKVYGAYSATIKQKVQPARVVISSVSKKSYHSLKVKWKKVSGVTGYVVYRSTSPNGKYTKIKTVKGASKVTYTDKKRTCGKTYYYKVRAYKKSGKKNHYGYASVYMAGRTTPSSTKFNDKTMSGATTTDLRWNKSSGASGYEIYRSTAPKSGYVLVKDVPKGTTLKWKDSGLNADIRYYYKIRPYKSIGGTKVYGATSAVYTKYLVDERLDILITKYLGKPYKYGGNTPKGWDCSGFTQWALKFLYGKEIPRTSGQQAGGGKAINKNKMSSWKPGDVLLYKRKGGGYSHAALYIGDGKIMHALNGRVDTVIHTVSFYERHDGGNYLAAVRRY